MIRRLSVFLLAASVLSTPVYAAQEELTSVLYDCGVICSDTTEASRLCTLNYIDQTWTMEYQFTNSGSAADECFISAVKPSTLADSHEPVYTVSSDAADFESFFSFSPLLSASGLSDDTITPSDLQAFMTSSSLLPDDSGILYEISLDAASEEAKTVLSVTTLTEEGCKIYPIGCTYTASQGQYDLSVDAGIQKAFVFIVGTEGQDFNADPVSEFSIRSEASSLDSFIRLSCDIFLEEYPQDERITSELLADNLADYLEKSNVTAALDLVPTLQWMVKQNIYELYGGSFTLEPGQTVSVTFSRQAVLSVSEVLINPALSDRGVRLKENQIRCILPEEYTSASLRKASGSFDKETGILTVTKAQNGSYRIVAAKTPIWQLGYRYLIPMSGAMLVFLCLCAVSYLSRKKGQKQQQ